MIEPWPLTNSRIEKENRIFKLKTNVCVSPRTGREHDFYIIESGAWVNIIPLTTDEEVLLVKQFRHGTREITLEIPGGLVDEGQSPAEAALRELEEETGYTGTPVILLGKNRPNPAILNNWCYSYLVRDVKPNGSKKLDETEDLELVKVPLVDIPEMIRQGKIDHALVLTAFHFFDLMGK